jgi:hypothetical protein
VKGINQKENEKQMKAVEKITAGRILETICIA